MNRLIHIPRPHRRPPLYGLALASLLALGLCACSTPSAPGTLSIPAATIVQRAALLMAGGDLISAEYLLTNMDVSLLEPELRLERNLLLQRILRQRRALAAHRPDAEPPADAAAMPDVDPQPDYGQAQGQMLEDLGDVLEAARGYWQQLNASGRRPHTTTGLWRSLNRLGDARLAELLETERGGFRGWLELTVINRRLHRSIEAQLQAYDDWKRRNPSHPAARNEPPHITARRALRARQPRRIALLLPLSGPLAGAGRSIRDGFMAAHYQALQAGYRVPQVDVVDSATGSLMRHYRNSLAGGAEMVIGPLEKRRVGLLQRRRSAAVPSLFLNSPPGGRSGAWLSLAVETEATQAAERIWDDGRRRVLVLTSPDGIGRRAADTFIAEFQRRGGTVLTSLAFEPGTEFSAELRRALHIDHSVRRAARMRALLGNDLASEGRRREDLDAIFMDASPVEARQIMPLLAFHLAQDLQVYGTSRIYSGVQDPKLNRDMDGIMFLGFPWLTDRDDSIMNALMEAGPPPPELLNLYGLGVDAWHLHQYLGPGRSGPLIYHGALGASTLSSGTIVRRQPWMQMHRGQARPLP